MGIIFGAVPVPAVDAPVDWTGLSMKWVGADGSEWSLSDSTDGTVMLPGVRGMSMPPIVHHRAAHASIPGARWRGLHVDVREVFWPLQVYSGDGSSQWVEKDRAFWRSLDPETTGTWVVTTPDGQSRSLTLRFTDDSQFTLDHDIVLDGWATYGITLEAEQPFWEGDPITTQWRPGAPVPFFGGGSAGTAVSISPSGALEDAAASSPGDVDSYVVWRVYGPVTSAVVGINGQAITIPFSVPAGQVLEIDTNPTAQTAMMGPVAGPLTVDKTGSLGTVSFAPLPGRTRSKMTPLSLNGTGYVQATYTPRHYRAW